MQSDHPDLHIQLLEPQVVDHSARTLFAGVAAFAVVVVGVAAWWSSARPAPAAPVAAAHANTMSSAPATVSSAPHGTDADQVASMIERLATRLKDKPQDAEGWAMLARSYSVLGRHGEALGAYKKAIALRKDDANLLADYADSLAVQNNRVLSGEPIQLVAQALKLEPHNLKALAMAGSEAFDRQDYPKAVKYWQQVVEFGAADSPMVQQVLPSLEQAMQLAGVAGAAPKITAREATQPAPAQGFAALSKP